MFTLLRRQDRNTTGITWLWQHAAMGARSGDLDLLAGRSVTDAVEWFVDPDGAGVEAAPDPWAELDLATERGDNRGRQQASLRAIEAWVASMVDGPRPLLEQMTWFWHGHLVSALAEVRDSRLLVGQLRLFRRQALDGDLRTLLREVTIDPAMLLYLNGAQSTGEAPNENYSRELLELFALGIGNYTEADVQAGARALTGWTLDRRDPTGSPALYRPRRHDDTPQRYLGVDGVHDLDTVIDAVLAHGACGPFVARSIARHLLGPGLPQELTDAWGRDFAADGYRFRPLLRAILTHGATDPTGLSPEVTSPLPWAVAVMRALEIREVPRGAALTLRAAGQVPMSPPNVAGWPRGDAWLSATPTLARANMALVLAAASPSTSAARRAASAGDLTGLAAALGVEAFGDATAAAVAQAATPVEGLAAALVSDDVVVR